MKKTNRQKSLCKYIQTNIVLLYLHQLAVFSAHLGNIAGTELSLWYCCLVIPMLWEVIRFLRGGGGSARGGYGGVGVTFPSWHTGKLKKWHCPYVVFPCPGLFPKPLLLFRTKDEGWHYNSPYSHLGVDNAMYYSWIWL